MPETNCNAAGFRSFGINVTHIRPSLQCTSRAAKQLLNRRKSARKLQCTIVMAGANLTTSEQFTGTLHQLADAAAEVSRSYFRCGVEVDLKTDASPVTIADRQAEQVMRDILAAEFPEHGVFGEEYGLKESTGNGRDYLWVLDPIDGTKSFITGKPLFGTLIALLYRGKPVAGVIDQPILKERWLGIAGQQTTLNGLPISTRRCPALSSAYLYSTTPLMFDDATRPAYNRVASAVRVPLYGCDCYAYGLMAAGHCDLVVEADLKPYDYMALVPIIEGAGGVITDWKGNALSWDPLLSNDDATGAAYPGEVVAAGDKECHAQALALLCGGT